MGLGENARFLLHFLRNPVVTGAVVPSSRHLAALMVAEMGLGEARTVVEVGPGTGAFTQAIIREVRPDARVVAVELNAEFAADLARRFPRVDVVNDSAENLLRHARDADCVLSSLPWAGFPRDLQERLMRAIVDGLRPGGRFATFAYIHASWLPAARRFRRLLESVFSDVATTRVEWRNVPPALVYRCRR